MLLQFTLEKPYAYVEIDSLLPGPTDSAPVQLLHCNERCEESYQKRKKPGSGVKYNNTKLITLRRLNAYGL